MFNYKLIKSFIFRCLIALIFFFSFSIILSNDKIYYQIYDIVFGNSIDFSYIKSKTSFFLGNITGNKTSFVSSEKLEYSDISKYDNSSKITTGKNYVIKSLQSGVVIYIGNKEDLGNTIIILGDDQINYWYSNIENISVNMYDYIEKNTILGSTKDDSFYLTMNKGDDYIYYEDTI